MVGKSGARGVIHAKRGDGTPVAISVSWRRGTTYLGLDGREHPVHPSNLRRANGFALEAMLVYHVTDATFQPY